MKRKKYSLSMLSLILTFLLYLFCASTAMASEKASLITESADGETQDILSTGRELINWLEAHKYTGGRACLGDHIVLEESYIFMPRPNGSALVVETGSYSILVNSDIEFWSDGQLSFQGSGGQSLFRVKKGGSLLLDGVNVDCPSGGYSLWQEEGAGLIVADTFAKGRISGNIHYAEKPFVTEAENVCVIVKQGESVYNSLPTEIKCRVSKQGQCLYNEPVAVSWELAGTEKQQEERIRFQVEGCFLEAESGALPVCTVVYDDYPLTFTKTEAFAGGNFYTFRGEYTKPEGEPLITVTIAYSFDGENWMTDMKDMVSDVSDGFYLVFPCDQWDTTQHSYIYIRLQGEKDGKEYVSNVLRYAADNLNVAEDIGGGRGGGNAIVNPPSLPEEKSADSPSLSEEKPVDSTAETNQSWEEQDPSKDSKSSAESNLSEDIKLSDDPKESDYWIQSEKYQAPESDSEGTKGTGSTETGNDRQSAAGMVNRSENNNRSRQEESEAMTDTVAADNTGNNIITAGNKSNDIKQQNAARVSSGMVSSAEQIYGQQRNLMIAGGIVLLVFLAGVVAYFWSGTKR